MIFTSVAVPMVKKHFCFHEDQKLGVNDLRFIKVLYILEMETCILSGILLARASSLLSEMFDILLIAFG